jgi:putative thioredoxin
MEESSIKSVGPDTFQTDVIEKSENLPVFVLFWAEQVEPSVQMRNLLASLIQQYQGKAELVLSDVSQDQSLAQTLRVQGLPSIRVIFKGKIVEQIDGPTEEAHLKGILETLTQSPSDVLKGQLSGFLEEKDWDSALALIKQAIEQEPNNQGFRVELADLLVKKGDTDEAGKVLATIPDDAENVKRPRTRLEFLEESSAMPSADELHQTEITELNKLEIAYGRAVWLTMEEHYQEALDLCLEILSTDREFRDDIGRLTMIRIFDLMDKGDEMASVYRRKMFNLMH